MAALSAFAAPAHAQSINRLIKPFYGNIQPFYGNLTPFYGNLQPFYGNLQPFYGNLTPFYGNLSPFFGGDAAAPSYWGNDAAFSGATKLWWGTLDPVSKPDSNAPAYLTIRPFWNQAGTTWNAIFGAWGQIDPATATAADYAPVATQLKGLMDTSAAFWGAAVQAKTGRSFDAAVAQPILAKWGIDLNDPTSLQKLSPSQRASFFLDFYDHVMNFAGTDHVDYWMKLVDWSPNLTQTQGSGQHTTIGLLDMTVVGDTTLQKNIVTYSGVSSFTNGHGAAVGSLLVGAHDRQGVMGIAPKASVIAYNPFDSTGTAGWGDIYNGILMLAQNNASIVNMSLGVPGVTLDQGWNDYVFSNDTMARATKNMIFVTAAGNDGVTQTSNINWNFKTNPNLIVVGSVDITGNISNFSNRPGTACLVSNGSCSPGNQLMNHFIVAPGEMILMSDDHGGVLRQTGTSFAAPLVSGAIALLHDRWPWLKYYPGETAYIILHSAKDLGAPGPDPVYGMGLLDIQASQSPLSMDAVHWLVVSSGGRITEVPAVTVLNPYKHMNTTAFDASKAYFYAYETVGSTLRDFAIPMSSKLVGQTFTALSGYQAYFQGYLDNQFEVWAKSKGYFSATDTGGTYDLANRWGADLKLSIAPKAPSFGFRSDGAAYQTAVHLTGERYKLSAGYGDGAVLIAGQPGFGLASDFQATRGGANPLLGLASGGAYANMSYALSDRLQISAGATQRNEHRDGVQTPIFDQPGDGAQAYRAGAEHVALDYRLGRSLELMGSYTRLREDSAVLGVQSLDPRDFAGGSVTDGVTFGFNWTATPKLSLSAAGTVAKTRAANSGQNIAVAKDGLTSQAFQVSMTGHDLFAKGDAARVTLAQPMFVNHGRFDMKSVEVVDRDTGELGIVTHSFDVAQPGAYSAEAFYSVPTLHRMGEVSLFGRAETHAATGQASPAAYVAGGRFRLAF